MRPMPLFWSFYDGICTHRTAGPGYGPLRHNLSDPVQPGGGLQHDLRHGSPLREEQGQTDQISLPTGNWCYNRRPGRSAADGPDQLCDRTRPAQSALPLRPELPVAAGPVSQQLFSRLPPRLLLVAAAGNKKTRVETIDFVCR